MQRAGRAIRPHQSPADLTYLVVGAPHHEKTGVGRSDGDALADALGIKSNSERIENDVAANAPRAHAVAVARHHEREIPANSGDRRRPAVGRTNQERAGRRYRHQGRRVGRCCGDDEKGNRDERSEHRGEYASLRLSVQNGRAMRPRLHLRQRDQLGPATRCGNWAEPVQVV